MNEDTQVEVIREQLIKLAQEKKIATSPAKIRKLKPQAVLEMYNDFKAQELDELNEMFTDVLIIKLEDCLKYFHTISSESRLAQKLQDKKLFRSDVKSFVSYITPLLPFAGLLEGAVVIATEVVENFSNKNESSHEEKPDDSYLSEEGE